MPRNSFDFLSLFQILLLITTNINGKTLENAQNIASISSNTAITNEIHNKMNEDHSLLSTEVCASDSSYDFNVTYRTSSSFTAFVTYNCSLIDLWQLSVDFNQTGSVYCYKNTVFPDAKTVEVTCYNIQNNAGRNWTFSLVQDFVSTQIILNETFTIILKPLPLYFNTNISSTVNREERTVSIFISNCMAISDLKYLVVRCDTFDQSNNTLSDNCTHTCSNLEHGSIYNASLVRLAIPMMGENNDILEEESLHQIYQIDLDKVTNLYFNDGNVDKKTALIYFTPPRGNYDEISLTCSAKDQYCSSGNTYLMNSTTNCSTCNFILISPIIRGVTYRCQATTIKQFFSNVISDELEFNTSLEPVLYSGLNSFNRSSIDLVVSGESDYSSFELTCLVDNHATYPCLNVIKSLFSCQSTFNFNGVLGCNYRCYFITKKFNYVDTYSDEYQLKFFSPKPRIYEHTEGSRWIYISWIIDEVAYIRSFEIFIDHSAIALVNETIFSYNYTNLLPNQNYALHVQINSDPPVLSDLIYIKTLTESTNTFPPWPWERIITFPPWAWESTSTFPPWPGESTSTFSTSETPNSSSKAWIAVFPICTLFLMIIVGLIIWKRRELKQCWRKKFSGDNQMTSASLFVYNIRPMNPKFLSEYINLTEDDQRNLRNEFKDLRNLAPNYNPLIENCTNDLFDRYDDIPSRGPWHKTAVHLTDSHRLHDYINANYIQGVNNIKQYIACQSPIKNTCEDFWDMIIQHKITKIIMLNQFQDNNHSQSNKTYPYIPMNKNQLLNFGRFNIQVKNIEFQMNNQLEIRHLTIKTKNENQCDVIHYLFTSWPELTVIESEKLINLIEIINQYSTKFTVPIIVHCSSGTGRTGTYIAVDIIIRLLNQSTIEDLPKMKLDIMGIVNQLKHDRVNMVQKSDQYLLIHHCLEQYLKQTNRLDILKRSSIDYEIISEQHEVFDNLQTIDNNAKDDEIYHNYYSVQNDES